MSDLNPTQRAAMEYATSAVTSSSDVYVTRDGTLWVDGQIQRIKRRLPRILLFAEVVERIIRDGSGEDVLRECFEELRLRGVPEKKMYELQAFHTAVFHWVERTKGKKVARYAREDAASAGANSTGNAGDT